jgi:hypothetical protein
MMRPAELLHMPCPFYLGCDGYVLLLLHCCRSTGLTGTCPCLVLLRMMWPMSVRETSPLRSS